MDALVRHTLSDTPDNFRFEAGAWVFALKKKISMYVVSMKLERKGILNRTTRRVVYCSTIAQSRA